MRLELELLITMPLTQLLSFAPTTDADAGSSKDQRWRLPALCGLFLLAFGGNLFLASQTPAVDTPQHAFVSLWQLTYLPYLAGCLLILATHQPSSRKWQRAELGVILLGAFFLRLPLLFLEPNLSHDSWRYLWDARVFLHEYSPYVYAPGDHKLAFLRDVLFARSRYRNVPTIYPPGAQYVYILSSFLVTVVSGQHIMCWRTIRCWLNCSLPPFLFPVLPFLFCCRKGAALVTSQVA